MTITKLTLKKPRPTLAQQQEDDDSFHAALEMYVGGLKSCETLQDINDFKQAIIDLELQYPRRYTADIERLHTLLRIRKQEILSK